MKTRGVIYRGRVRAIEDAVEVWKASHDDAMEVRDVEDLIREWLWASELWIQWQEDAWQLLRAGQLKKTQEAGRALQWAHNAGLGLVATLEECLRSAEKAGYAVDNAGEFREKARALQRAYDNFLKRWPFADNQTIAEGLASLERGEGIDLGGWIRELQSGDQPPGPD